MSRPAPEVHTSTWRSLDDLSGAVEARGLRPRAALLPGDPGRVDRLGELFDGPELVFDSTPVRVLAARLDGQDVVVASTGMGGPGTVLVTEALGALGIALFIRVGGAGPVAEGVANEELLVATAAVRQEGTSAAFCPAGWPAVASPHVVAALLDGARRAGHAARAGVLQTKDSFYGEVEPASSPVEAELRDRWSAWQRLGVLGSEMEAAPLFALAMTRGWHAGAIVKVNDASASEEAKWSGDRDLCEAAVAGLAALLGGAS